MIVAGTALAAAVAALGVDSSRGGAGGKGRGRVFGPKATPTHSTMLLFHTPGPPWDRDIARWKAEHDLQSTRSISHTRSHKEALKGIMGFATGDHDEVNIDTLLGNRRLFPSGGAYDISSTQIRITLNPSSDGSQIRARIFGSHDDPWYDDPWRARPNDRTVIRGDAGHEQMLEQALQALRVPMLHRLRRQDVYQTTIPIRTTIPDDPRLRDPQVFTAWVLDQVMNSYESYAEIYLQHSQGLKDAMRLIIKRYGVPVSD